MHADLLYRHIQGNRRMRWAIMITGGISQRKEDIRKMLDKIKAAGITPASTSSILHRTEKQICHPVADHRLNVTRRFTLARPLGKDDTVVYVEQNPEGTVMADRCRMQIRRRADFSRGIPLSRHIASPAQTRRTFYNC